MGFCLFLAQKDTFPLISITVSVLFVSQVFGSQRDFNFRTVMLALPDPNELTILQMQLVCNRPFTSLPRLSPQGARPGSSSPPLSITDVRVFLDCVVNNTKQIRSEF